MPTAIVTNMLTIFLTRYTLLSGVMLLHRNGWVHKTGRLELPFVVSDTATGETFAATFSFKRAFGRGAKRAQR